MSDIGPGSDARTPQGEPRPGTYHPADLSVARWTKYGHDRLYVNAPDGSRVGWLDLATGQARVERPELADAFQAAITAWQATQSPPFSTDATPPPEPDWTDLAQHRPGEGVRGQADDHLAAMKDRSHLLTAAARLLDTKTPERAWRKGADGEESIGARLERLTKHGWHVLHSVPVGTRGADIDHVLIGHGGVYTVNTKNHPGKRIWVSPNQIRVDGHPVPSLPKARHEADRARRLLTAAVGWDVPVKPVLVLLTGTLLPQVDIKSGGPSDVLILDRMEVPGVFKRAPVRLQPSQVAAVFEAARRSTTWSPG